MSILVPKVRLYINSHGKFGNVVFGTSGARACRGVKACEGARAIVRDMRFRYAFVGVHIYRELVSDHNITTLNTLILKKNAAKSGIWPRSEYRFIAIKKRISM